jgi:hypothetical protein
MDNFGSIKDKESLFKEIYMRSFAIHRETLVLLPLLLPYLPDYTMSGPGSINSVSINAVTHKHGRSLRGESQRCREETSKIRVKSSVLYRRRGARNIPGDSRHPRLLLAGTGCCVRVDLNSLVGTVYFIFSKLINS